MINLCIKGLGVEWGAISSPSPDTMLQELSSHLLQSLDGFVFVLTADAKIIYVSETASVHLGLSQVELTGNSIYDFIHSSDCEEMKSLLSYNENVTPQKRVDEDIEVARSFCLRMKCILAKRNAGLTSDGYKVIHCRGYLKMRSALYSPSDDATSTSFRHQVVGLVAFGHSLPSTSITEIKMSNDTFMLRAGMDLTVIYIDSRTQLLTGYEPQHLMDKSLYQFIHPEDSLRMSQDHTTLLMKGQVVTSYYRFLTRTGGWIWIQSHCTIIHNSRASRQHCVLALNHALSEREHEEKLLDREQMQEPKFSIYNTAYHTTAAVPAKRSRLSSKAANNAMSELNMGPLSLDSSSIGNYVHPANLLGDLSKNSPNESLYRYFDLCKSDLDRQVPSSFVEFDQDRKSCPSAYDCSERLYFANMPSLVHYDFNPQDSFPNNYPFPITNYGAPVNYNTSYFDVTSSTNINNRYLPSPKLDVSGEAVVDSLTNFLSPHPVYSQDSHTKYASQHGSFNIAQCIEKLPCYEIDNNSLECYNKQDEMCEVSSIPDFNQGMEKLPYYVEKIDNNSFARSNRQEGSNGVSSIPNFNQDMEKLPYYVEKIDNNSLACSNRQKENSEISSHFNSAKSYLESNGDINCDTCPPGISFKMDSHDLIENSRSTYEKIASNLCLNNADLESVQCQKMESITSPQPLFSSLTDQNMNMSSNGSPFDVNSSHSSVYLNAFNNFIPCAKHTLLQGDYQPVISSNGKTLLTDLNVRKSYFDTNSAVTNEMKCVDHKSSIDNVIFSAPTLIPQENFSPLPLHSEMDEIDPDSEQKLSSEHSSGFCDCTSQYTVSSPRTSDSSYVKSGTSSDTISEKTTSPESPSSYLSSKSLNS